jgi:hypothetical protein
MNRHRVEWSIELLNVVLIAEGRFTKPMTLAIPLEVKELRLILKSRLDCEVSQT